MNKQLLTYNVMTAVQSSYTAEALSDSEFAKKLTHILNEPVSTARVRQARTVLSIENNKQGDKSVEKLNKAKELIATLLTRKLSADERIAAEEFINGL